MLWSYTGNFLDLVNRWFVCLQALEQQGYPSDRYDLTSLDVIECLTNVWVTVLPGITSEDIFWNTSAFYLDAPALWDSAQTTHIQFELAYAPNAINSNAPTEDSVYHHFKDIIDSFVTSGKFLKKAKISCDPWLDVVNHVYLSVSTQSEGTEGSNGNSREKKPGVVYTWILFLLLVPVTLAMYSCYNGNFISNSKYEEDRITEMEQAFKESKDELAEEEQRAEEIPEPVEPVDDV